MNNYDLIKITDLYKGAEFGADNERTLQTYLKSQARPKSDILTWPCSSRRMLAGFRSRYTI